MSTWNPVMNPTYGVVNLITATFAFSGELFVIITYYRYRKHLESPQMNLVLGLIFTDLIETISNFGFYFTGGSQFTCVANGFVREYGLISSVFWVLSISHYAKWFVTGDITREPTFRS